MGISFLQKCIYRCKKTNRNGVFFGDFMAFPGYHIYIYAHSLFWRGFRIINYEDNTEN